MSGTMKYRGYVGSVDFSEEDVENLRKNHLKEAEEK